MSEETPGASSPAFSQKEMLVRIDAKVDVIAAKQQHYDVELALIKERQHQTDLLVAAHASREETERKSLADNLEKREAKMDQEVAILKNGQISVQRLVKYATGIIIAAGIVADAVIRFYK